MHYNVLRAPVVISLMLNLLFLCNIVRVLFMKLRAPAGPQGGAPSRNILQAFRYVHWKRTMFVYQFIFVYCHCQSIILSISIYFDMNGKWVSERAWAQYHAVISFVSSSLAVFHWKTENKNYPSTKSIATLCMFRNRIDANSLIRIFNCWRSSLLLFA